MTPRQSSNSRSSARKLKRCATKSSGSASVLKKLAPGLSADTPVGVDSNQPLIHNVASFFLRANRIRRSAVASSACGVLIQSKSPM